MIKYKKMQIIYQETDDIECVHGIFKQEELNNFVRDLALSNEYIPVARKTILIIEYKYHYIHIKNLALLFSFIQEDKLVYCNDVTGLNDVFK